MTPVDLGWLAAMAVETGNTRMADSYLMELLAWCTFGDPANRTQPS